MCKFTQLVCTYCHRFVENRSEPCDEANDNARVIMAQTRTQIIPPIIPQCPGGVKYGKGNYAGFCSQCEADVKGMEDPGRAMEYKIEERKQYYSRG